MAESVDQIIAEKLDPEIVFLGTFSKQYDSKNGFSAEIKTRIADSLKKYNLLEENSNKIKFSDGNTLDDLCKWNMRDLMGPRSFASRVTRTYSTALTEINNQVKDNRLEVLDAENTLTALGAFINSLISIKNRELSEDRQIAPILTSPSVILENY